MNVIFQSTYYSLYQGDRERSYYVDFGHKLVRMSLCQLLALRHKVHSIPIEDHFDANLNKHGFEVLLLCNKEHLLILNTLEILDLKSLVDEGLIALGLSVGKAMARV